MASKQVYVALLDEGVDVWRPVRARDLGSGHFEVMGIVPAMERWQFEPGTRVRCREHRFADGVTGLVAYAAVLPEDPVE